MKILSIVGARPQFIKAAVLSREIRKEHTEILVHTGQHYDANMSDIFFKDLEIPAPDYNLGIGSGQHGQQTGAMLAAIEDVLLKEQPDWVVVFGDTNSTLAGALAAVKLHIKVAHVEAGLRSFNRKMPEEINRILTDHVSDLLLCPTQAAVNNLKTEGITQGVYLVGDVMQEGLHWALERSNISSSILDQLSLTLQKYFLVTVHRAENTDDNARLQGILDTFNLLQETLVWPIHPRTKKMIAGMGWKPSDKIRMIDPVGYLDVVALESNAHVIITDSGGMQKEAFWLGVPCVTLRDETEWVETLTDDSNILAGADRERILGALNKQQVKSQGISKFDQKLDLVRVIQLLEKG